MRVRSCVDSRNCRKQMTESTSTQGWQTSVRLVKVVIAALRAARVDVDDVLRRAGILSYGIHAPEANAELHLCHFSSRLVCPLAPIKACADNGGKCGECAARLCENSWL